MVWKKGDLSLYDPLYPNPTPGFSVLWLVDSTESLSGQLKSCYAAARLVSVEL